MILKNGWLVGNNQASIPAGEDQLIRGQHGGSEEARRRDGQPVSAG